MKPACTASGSFICRGKHIVPHFKASTDSVNPCNLGWSCDQRTSTAYSTACTDGTATPYHLSTKGKMVLYSAFRTCSRWFTIFRLRKWTDKLKLRRVKCFLTMRRHDIVLKQKSRCDRKGRVLDETSHCQNYRFYSWWKIFDFSNLDPIHVSIRQRA